jgi:hypothetical protein
MKSHVYAFDAKPVDKEQWFLYFNARNDWHWSKGREHIGLLIGKKTNIKYHTNVQTSSLMAFVAIYGF